MYVMLFYNDNIFNIKININIHIIIYICIIIIIYLGETNSSFMVKVCLLN